MWKVRHILLEYIFDDSNLWVFRSSFKKGSDSVRLLLENNNEQNRTLLNLMLRDF